MEFENTFLTSQANYWRIGMSFSIFAADALGTEMFKEVSRAQRQSALVSAARSVSHSSGTN
jgi:hypothetical protein